MRLTPQVPVKIVVFTKLLTLKRAFFRQQSGYFPLANRYIDQSPMNHPYSWIEDSLKTLHRANWYRRVKTIQGRGGAVRIRGSIAD